METVYRTKISDNGRMLIPAGCRKQLGFKHNEELLLRVDEHGMHIAPLIQHLRAFRSKMRENLPAGVNLLDELRQMRAHDDE